MKTKQQFLVEEEKTVSALRKEIIRAHYSAMGKKASITNKKKGKKYWQELARRSNIAQGRGVDKSEKVIEV